MREILFTLLGSILSIVVTWVFNLISSKRQHKMEMQRLAVQNKLEVSKTAISWLMEAKNELYVCIWSLEQYPDLEPNMLLSVVERSKKLTALEADARNNFNAIELYYNLDDIANKYNLWETISRMLTLQNSVAGLNNNTQNSIEDYEKAINELLSIFIPLHSAIAEIIEHIRQDNLSYLK